MESELYHIHLKGNKDFKWQVGNTINIDKTFDSIMNQRQQNFCQLIKLNNTNVQYSIYLAQYFDEIQNKTSIKKEELEKLKSLLEAGYRLSHNANFFKRESSLEDCRKDNYSSLPSRLHSIYLCDKDEIEYWQDNIIEQNKESEIFKVYATGTIFKTNEQLLPKEETTYGESYNASFKYWNPKFKDVPNYTNEYLVQGKVKILEKLK